MDGIARLALVDMRNALAGDARALSEPTNYSHVEDTPMDRILELEKELDRHALRLQALAAEPSPWVCEGVAFATAQRASTRRGELFEMLLQRIDALNAERLTLLGVPHAA